LVSFFAGEEKLRDPILLNDRKDLKFIEDSLKKNQQLTQQMVNLMKSFETRLTSLETEILPIHKDSIRLKTAHESKTPPTTTSTQLGVLVFSLV
jgi:hypothetical protein